MPRSKKIDANKQSFAIGELVFAKIKYYPPWPGKIISTVGNAYNVEFFGSHDSAKIEFKDLATYDEANRKILINDKSLKKKNFKEAVEEIEALKMLDPGASSSHASDETKQDSIEDESVAEASSQTETAPKPQKNALKAKFASKPTSTKVLRKRKLLEEVQMEAEPVQPQRSVENENIENLETLKSTKQQKTEKGLEGESSLNPLRDDKLVTVARLVSSQDLLKTRDQKGSVEKKHSMNHEEKEAAEPAIETQKSPSPLQVETKQTDSSEAECFTKASSESKTVSKPQKKPSKNRIETELTITKASRKHKLDEGAQDIKAVEPTSKRQKIEAPHCSKAGKESDSVDLEDQLKVNDPRDTVEKNISMNIEDKEAEKLEQEIEDVPANEDNTFVTQQPIIQNNSNEPTTNVESKCASKDDWIETQQIELKLVEKIPQAGDSEANGSEIIQVIEAFEKIKDESIEKVSTSSIQHMNNDQEELFDDLLKIPTVSQRKDHESSCEKELTPVFGTCEEQIKLVQEPGDCKKNETSSSNDTSVSSSSIDTSYLSSSVESAASTHAAKDLSFSSDRRAAFEMFVIKNNVSEVLFDDQKKSNLDKGLQYLDDFMNRVMPDITKLTMLKFPQVIDYFAELLSFQIIANDAESKVKKVRSTALEILLQFMKIFGASSVITFLSTFANEKADFQEKIKMLDKDEVLFQTFTMEALEVLIKEASGAKVYP